MKYLPNKLREMYERELRLMRVTELGERYINEIDVLRGYFILADFFTDPSSNTEIESMLVGVRDANLLSSAILRQVVSLGKKMKYTQDIDICATLFFGLVKNHAFLDGNKRVAMLTLLYQLNKYNYFPKASPEDFEHLVLAVAANELRVKYEWVWEKEANKEDREVQVIASMLRKMTEKKDHSFHLTITSREFIDVLTKANVLCEIKNSKLRLTNTTMNLQGEEVVWKYALDFGGDTRPLGPKTVREALQALQIYDQYPSYKNIMEGREPFYQLIADFEQPFRRLKDE